MVSGDLHMHPVGYFLEALLTHLDRHRFSVHIYSNSFKEDQLTLNLKTQCDAWRNLRFSNDAEGAQQIASDEIDVLFDLSGHTGKNRLGVFAIRAAPVQVSWLGYWASTGLETMDYILADPHCLPPEDEAHYSERVLRMPVTRLCFGESLAKAPPPTASPQVANGFLTFGCFQSVHKIGPEVVAAWSAILKRLPAAHLKVRNLQFTDPKVQDSVRAKFQAAGLPSDRVHLLPPLSRDGYLQAYADIDVCLDTFPFPGGTTTCDALWMGVPTVTRRGQNMIGRQGEAMMTAAGLSDWVAHDVASYVEKACAAGTDPSALQQLRRGLRARVKASPLFDGSRFARDFGNVIEELVRDPVREIGKFADKFHSEAR
jgi:predicted O-linked N-acetylglucosamine transferase (SPINDLY family)